MSRSFSRRVLVRIVSYSLAAAVLLLGAGISGYKLMSRYKTTIEYKYQSALNNLSDYMSNIKSTLEKGLYANTAAQQQPLLAKLMTMTEGAKASMGQLPISGEQSETIQKYFAQIGDFSSFALTKLAKDIPLSDEERETLSIFYEYAKELDMSISDISAIYGNGGIDLGESITLTGNLENIGDEVEELTLDSGFREMNEGFTDYPTMIYDGPFSDHMLRQEAMLLKGQKEITKYEALAVASDFIGCSQGDLSYDGESGGNLPTYNFSGKDIYITVTKVGGMINIFERYSDVHESKLNFAQATEKAKKFLKQELGNDFSESYYVNQGNICTINFAYTENETVYYSDLIKVGIDMSSGEVASYCATGYIMNHRKREQSSPVLTQEEAEQSVSPLLKVESTKQTVIPNGGTNEALCYEFTCKSGDETVLVYINAETGMEEQIYIVLQQDNGILVV
ncbi:MAG: germination protein YpeB [Lachnospiraceae bacterium]|nr:germination protein YpeB [Lachnospiraceae bacterium]